MATIKIKRGTTDPSAAQVTNAGELAANTSTPKIWLKTADDSSTTPIWVGAQIETSPADWTSSTKLATQSAINTTFMPKSGGTFTSDLSLSGGADIRFIETGGGSDYIAFQAPASIATSVTFTLPSADGSNGNVLTTNGSGTLSWGAASASSLAVTADNSTSTFYPTFVTGSGSGLTLYADPSTTPLSYIPNPGVLKSTGGFQGNGLTSALDNTGMSITSTGDEDNATLTLTGSASILGATANLSATTTTIASRTLNLGSGLGTMTIDSGTVTMTGSTLELPTSYTIRDSATSASSTLNIMNQSTASTFTKTVNIGANTASGGTSAVNIATSMNGSGTASVTIGSSTGTSTTTLDGTVTVTNDLAVNGGDLTTTSGTATVFNSNATTLNMGQAATTVSIGATTGTTTVRNDLNIASGKVYQINATSILSATTLGSSVVSSSLTSVGTIATGVWEATDVGVAHGGTGTSDGSITGTGALTFTAGGTNTNVNLVPNGNGTVDVGSKRITNLATPSSSTDAATRGYVDSVAQGLHFHATAKGATTATLATLSGATVSYSGGTQAITWTGGTALTSTFTDGVSFTASTTESSASRILVKNEGDVGGLGAAYNGIYYVYGARELRRSVDANTAAEYIGGDFIFILEGTTYNNTGWVQTEVITTLDTDSILWDQFSGAGTFIADEVTLTKSGDTFSIKSTYIGQSSITTLGTIGTGTWQGTVVGLTYGGTGKALTASNGGIVYTDADSMEVLAAGTSGYVLTSGGSGAPSWTNATDANTTSAIVQRDGSGNFSAGTITASLTGTASNASAVTMASETSDTTCFLAFVNAASASSQALKYNSSLAYNSSTNYLDVNIDGGTY